MSKNINDTALHPEIRDRLIAFKMTQTEKNELEEYCKVNGFSISRFVRFAVKKSMDK